MLQNVVLIFSGFFCEDEDECASDEFNICNENSTCVNTEGFYECTCRDGFRLSDIEQSCVEIRNTLNCLSVQDQVWWIIDVILNVIAAPEEDICGCGDHGVCDSATERCNCAEGFVFDEELGCVDDDECLRPGSCHRRAECSNYEGGIQKFYKPSEEYEEIFLTNVCVVIWLL